MKALNQQKTELFRNILLITLGSLLYALNFDLFLEPGGISSGGVSGIAMIIVYAAHPKFLTVGILNAMINIPLFLCGLKKIGRHFFFGSLYSTVLTSVFLDLFARILPVPTVEPLVAALFGGVFMGVSLGLVFLGNASTGGVDIVASSPPWRSTASSTAWIIPRSRSSSRRSMRPSPRPSTASSTAA